MSNYIMHFGINGMKWGIRRYQNPDGTLTPEGKERYSKSIPKRMVKAAVKEANAANGTKIRYDKHTVVEKFGNKYDYKGKRINPNPPKVYSNKQKRKLSPRDLRNMSNEELQQLYERKRLEADIRRLQKDTNTTPEKLAEAIAEGLVGGVNQGTSRGVADAIDRYLDTATRVSLERSEHKYNRKRSNTEADEDFARRIREAAESDNAAKQREYDAYVKRNEAELNKKAAENDMKFNQTVRSNSESAKKYSSDKQRERAEEANDALFDQWLKTNFPDYERRNQNKKKKKN